MTTDEQQLKNLYREMWCALLAKDITTLERIHAEEFVLTHMTGMKQPREEYFRCVRDSELNYRVKSRRTADESFAGKWQSA